MRNKKMSLIFTVSIIVLLIANLIAFRSCRVTLWVQNGPLGSYLYDVSYSGKITVSRYNDAVTLPGVKRRCIPQHTAVLYPEKSDIKVIRSMVQDLKRSRSNGVNAGFIGIQPPFINAKIGTTYYSYSIFCEEHNHEELDNNEELKKLFDKVASLVPIDWSWGFRFKNVKYIKGEEDIIKWFLSDDKG